MNPPQPLYLLSETLTSMFAGIGPHSAAKALRNFIQTPQLFKAYLARNGKESGVSGCGTGPPSRLLAPLKIPLYARNKMPANYLHLRYVVGFAACTLVWPQVCRNIVARSNLFSSSVLRAV